MKLIFTFIIMVVVVSLNEAQGAPSLVDPDTDDTEWGDIEDDYDYVYCKQFSSLNLQQYNNFNNADDSGEESEEKVTRFPDVGAVAEREFVGPCVENCNNN